MALPLLLRGEKLSLLERSGSILSASQTPDALYPLSRLGDTRPSQLFIFPTAAEDDYIMIDVDQYLNGDFENWTSGDPNDHTVNVTGTGAVTEETTSPIETGSSSMELDNGASGTVEVLQDIEVLAGEQVELRYASQTSNASSPATMEVYNPHTGKWLTTSGAWSAQRQNAIESVLTSMAMATLSFTVESFADVRKHSFDLEIRYHMDAAAVSILHHWDAVQFITGIDFTSLHAHNMSAGIQPILSSSDEDISASKMNSFTRFPSTNRRIRRSAIFEGAPDGRTGTVSCWFEITASDGTAQQIFDTENGHLRLYRSSGNKILILLADSGGTNRLVLETTGSVTADGAQHHIAISFDVDGAAADQRVFLDGATGHTPTTLSAGDIDFTSTNFTIGARYDATLPLEGDLSALWFSTTDMRLTVGKLLAFRTAGGNAAYLGENGELPTGTAPFLFWRGDSKLTNLGSGGNFDIEEGTGVIEIIATQAAITKQDVSFYKKLSAVKFSKYWRLRFLGTNAVDPIEIGQWVLGPALQPAWSPRLQDDSERRSFAQSRAIVESSGEQWAVKKAKHPRRTAKMRFNVKSPYQAAFKDELLARTSQGADPLVLVEDQSQTKVIHGRIPQDSDFTRRSLSLEQTELIVEESSNGVGLP